MDKSLARWTEKKRQHKLLKSEMKMGTLLLILKKSKDFKSILWIPVPNKLASLDEMDKFLETQNITKLNQEGKENVNRFKIIKE